MQRPSEISPPSDPQRMPKLHGCPLLLKFLNFSMLVLIAVVPRVARLRFHQAWFEDSAYLYHGFALLAGQRPFVEGIYAHPPAPEYLLAACYRIFGVSYRVAEALSAAVMAITTILIYKLCKKMTGPWTALIGAAAFSLSPLLFRYHVFEREVFTVALASLAFFWLQAGNDNRIRAALIGALAGVAAAVKISGIFLLPPIAAIYLLDGHRKAAAACMLGWLAVAGTFWGLLLLIYAKPAFHQLVVLHFVKGGTASAGANIRDVFIPNLNYLLVFGIGGLIIGVARQRDRILIAAVVLAVELGLFFTLISGTLWAHNMIDLLLPLSIGTALGIHAVASMYRRGRIRYAPATVMALAAVAVVLSGALKADHLMRGWGYVDRKQVAMVARFLREQVPPSARIIAPHYVAAEAQRLKLVDYRELAGPLLWMQATIEREGYRGLRRHRQFKSWKRMSRQTASFWQPFVNAAVQNRKVAAVVWDLVFPEWSHYQKIDLDLERTSGLFSQAGYRVRYQNGPYLVWLPENSK